LIKDKEISLISASSILVGPDRSVVPERTITAIVRHIDSTNDLIILEAKNEEFYPTKCHVLGYCGGGVEYLMLAMINEEVTVSL
jgi:hypothetical protein